MGLGVKKGSGKFRFSRGGRQGEARRKTVGFRGAERPSPITVIFLPFKNSLYPIMALTLPYITPEFFSSSKQILHDFEIEAPVRKTSRALRGGSIKLKATKSALRRSHQPIVP